MDGHYADRHYCRDFVGTYWPNKNTPGTQLKDMYARIAAADAITTGSTSQTGGAGGGKVAISGQSMHHQPPKATKA